MSLILQSAAHFVQCDECGNHGWIIAASGERSQNCVTKRQALSWLQVLNEQDAIPKDELGVVRDQIDASTLPDQNDVLEALAELESRIDLLEGIILDDDAPDEDAGEVECTRASAKPRMLQ